MGTIRKGGKGAFFGEGGSFIGSNWPDINYILGIPPVEFSATSLQKCNNQYTKTYLSSVYSWGVSKIIPFVKESEDSYPTVRRVKRAASLRIII